MRAAQAGVVLNLGMVNMVGNLYVPEATESKKATSFKNCCRECYEDDKSAVLVKNKRYCENDHGPLEGDDIVKGKEDEEGNVVVVGTTEEVKEAKESTLMTKVVDLVVHRAADVDRALFGGEGTAYVFLPTGDNEFYDVVMALMDEDGRILTDDGEDRVFVGGLRVRDTDHLVRLTKWNGHLVLKTMLRPEQLNEFPDLPERELSDKTLAMGRMLIEVNTEDFDPDDYKDENRERLAEWIKARSAGVTVESKPRTKAQVGQDLDSMLEAAVAMAKAKQAS